jgi:sn-glycerol 3-phosphate transport system substrate-binding protein
MWLRKLQWFTVGMIAACVSAVAFAQAPVEVSFFYPVAVGGPITKIVDGSRRISKRKIPESS